MQRDEKWIKLAAPLVGLEELNALKEVLESGRLVRGEKTKIFEYEISKFVGIKNSIALNSGTSALFALFKAIGLSSGDEVILPALTFPAAAECAVLLGAKPVFVDVSPETLNIDPTGVVRALSERTRVIVAIDQFGVPADYEPLLEIAQKNGVILIEDAACSLGAFYKGKPCGSFGKASILSFHPRKIITTGEGGMVLTDDDELSQKIDSLRNHGIGRNGDFEDAGLNLRMSEIHSAIGICQMRKIHEILKRRKEIKSIYEKKLSGFVKFQKEVEGGQSSWQTIVVMLDAKLGSRVRDSIISTMAQRKIELQVASFSAGRLKPYRRFCGGEKLEVSDYVHECGLALPAHSLMDEEDAEFVCKSFIEVLSKLQKEA